MNILKHIPTSPDKKFAKEECRKEMKSLHNKLFALQNLFYADGRFSLLVILQGMDTAGKDGSIRHVMSCMNPMGIQVKSFRKPTAEESAHDFLWRITPHFPAKGMIEVFNRSYYEDILAPLVDGKRPKEEILERCQTINVLEKHLESSGIHVLKIFLNISHDEQRKRVKERMTQPHKAWKYTRADKAAADNYDEYREAYECVLNECTASKWHIIPSDRRWYRNYAVAEILVKYLESLPLAFPGSKTKP